MNRIKAIALDVDGVLTDGGFWWGASGEELKRFSFRDVMGIALGRRAGLVFALISGEDSPLVDRFAQKMNIEDVYKGCKDKASALRAFAEKRGLILAEVAFMGDDVNDLGAMEIAGLAGAPADGHEAALRQAGVVTNQPGGQGAVREFVELVLSKCGQQPL